MPCQRALVQKTLDLSGRGYHWLWIGVGAEGFEPPSTGFLHAESDSARFGLWVIAPVSHHWSANPTEIIPITGARKDTRLPHTPLWSASGNLLLPQLLSPLPSSHLLLAPLPALLAAFLPGS